LQKVQSTTIRYIARFDNAIRSLAAKVVVKSLEANGYGNKNLVIQQP